MMSRVLKHHQPTRTPRIHFTSPPRPAPPRMQVKIFKNFAEKITLKLEFSPEGISGGALLAVRSPDAVCFYDWAEGRCVRRVDLEGVRSVHWNESGEQVRGREQETACY